MNLNTKLYYSSTTLKHILQHAMCPEKMKPKLLFPASAYHFSACNSSLLHQKLRLTQCPDRFILVVKYGQKKNALI